MAVKKIQNKIVTRCNMAPVTMIESSQKDRAKVHLPTRCLYCVVVDDQGTKYLQLDTVGKESREFPDKVSQSVQFGREAASQLITLLKQTYPDLN
jgi:hypothetical protein